MHRRITKPRKGNRPGVYRDDLLPFLLPFLGPSPANAGTSGSPFAPFPRLFATGGAEEAAMVTNERKSA